MTARNYSARLKRVKLVGEIVTVLVALSGMIYAGIQLYKDYREDEILELKEKTE